MTSNLVQNLTNIFSKLFGNEPFLIFELFSNEPFLFFKMLDNQLFNFKLNFNLKILLHRFCCNSISAWGLKDAFRKNAINWGKFLSGGQQC